MSILLFYRKNLIKKNSRIKTSRVIYSNYQFFPLFLFKILIRNIFKEQSYSKKKKRETFNEYSRDRNSNVIRKEEDQIKIQRGFGFTRVKK